MQQSNSKETTIIKASQEFFYFKIAQIYFPKSFLRLIQNKNICIRNLASSARQKEGYEIL